jgi:outer membrane protein insertion porin family
MKKIYFLYSFLILSSFAIGQINPNFSAGSQYVIGGIEVVGDYNFNPQTIITYTGLEKGQRIIIPGEDISNAIKKLGNLNLFDDIDFFEAETRGDTIFLEINIKELPKLSEVKITGLKKGKRESLITDNKLTKGKVVNENLITTTRNAIIDKFRKDGFYNTKVAIQTFADTTGANLVKMKIDVNRGEKVKISKIEIEGNDKLSDFKLKRAMKNTKQEFFGRLWKGSKYIKSDYKDDLVSLVDKYKEKGYRDARILYDSVIFDKEKEKIKIKLKIEEGKQYYFGNIKFLGNSVYSDEMLNRYLGIKKGDIYNGVLLDKRIKDEKSQDAQDIATLYQNSGYLFSNINPVEVKTANDTIDFEIRISEGPLVYFNKISVSGNDKTYDHVIYRELRTKPGQVYSKDDVIRTIREIGQLGFFDAQAINPNIKNPDPTAGTVDVEYELVEKGASQIELQGGYGGGGFIGTLGLSFNNFSLSNIFNRKAYKPLPMGEGQRMSLRLQASPFFQTYSLNFVEPWLGGKKPIQFSTSLSFSQQFLSNFNGGGVGAGGFGGGVGGGFGGDVGNNSLVDPNSYFNIISLNLGIGKRLERPDDYFMLSHALAYQYYDLNNYNTGLFTFGDGESHNINYTISLTRNNKGINPIYPTSGAEFRVLARFTPPYSLFNKTDYKALESQDEYKQRSTGPIIFDNIQYPTGTFLNSQGLPNLVNGVPSSLGAAVNQGKIDQKKFNFLEYYKFKFGGDFFTTLAGKTTDKALVLRLNGEFGFMGAYNPDRGNIPFERFFVGGDGLANFVMDGREIIQLRGYENNALTPFTTNPQTGATTRDGGTIYNKVTLELRYPITLKGQAQIFALGFLEAGSAWNDVKLYNPFKMQRSAGFGLRVFMPAFGLLGIDFGHGFDPSFNDPTRKSGWQTHFIIGQQF